MDIEMQLRAALAPCRPRVELRSRILARVAGSRRGSRAVLVGTVLAVAAAAAMLTLLIPGKSVEQPMSAKPVAVPAVPATSVQATPISTPVPVEAQRVKVAAPEEVVPAVTPFFVVVLPLEKNSTDAGGKAAIESFYTAFVTELRTVAGAVLLLPESGSLNDDQTNYYRLKTYGWGEGSKFRIGLEGAELSRSKDVKGIGPADPGGAVVGQQSASIAGDMSAVCVPSPEMSSFCASPAGVAVYLVNNLRRNLFPIDPAVTRRLQKQLLSASVEPRQRLKALISLADMKGSTGHGSDALRDPAIVAAAINIVATTSDPVLRGQVWEVMRESRHRDLVPAAVTSLQQDADGRVRLQAAAILQEGFASDPEVRKVLEVAAREDSRPLVRAVAQRVSGGEAAWKQYVFSSLKDTHRPDAERIEAFEYFSTQRSQYSEGLGFSSSGRLYRAREYIDDEVIQSLAELAGRMKDFQPIVAYVMSDLGSPKSPAMTSLALELLKSTVPFVKGRAIDELGKQLTDPRARAALEKVRTGGSDVAMREMADKALQGAGAM